MQGGSFNIMPWAEVKVQIMDLLDVIEAYCVRLRSQAKGTQLALKWCRSAMDRCITVCVNWTRRCHRLRYLTQSQSVNFSFPPHRRRSYKLIEVELLLNTGLSQKCVHYVIHMGGNKPSLHFLWRLEENMTEEDTIKRCVQLIWKLEVEAPIYERRITKKQFLESFGFVHGSVALRAISRDLTGDQSAV